jgi:Ca2+-binding RTX toxin-like protein
MDGGNNIDWAGYQNATSGVQMDMVLQSKKTGEAAGDFLVQVENLAGSIFNDRLLGTEGDNYLFGNYGDDMLWARGGNDRLDGFEGNDILYGVGGGDTLFGRTGNDLLSGGTGNDTFRFTDVAFGADTITDFEDNLDNLSFSLNVADDNSDFVITNNGTTSVTVTIGGQSITFNGAGTFTLLASDFIFQN